MQIVRLDNNHRPHHHHHHHHQGFAAPIPYTRSDLRPHSTLTGSRARTMLGSGRSRPESTLNHRHRWDLLLPVSRGDLETDMVNREWHGRAANGVLSPPDVDINTQVACHKKIVENCGARAATGQIMWACLFDLDSQHHFWAWPTEHTAASSNTVTRFFTIAVSRWLPAETETEAAKKGGTEPRRTAVQAVAAAAVAVKGCGVA